MPSKPVVPGGKTNILGGHSIGHTKQTTLNEHVSYSKRFPRQLFDCTVAKLLIKNILHTVSNTGISYSSDKVGTVYLV